MFEKVIPALSLVSALLVLSACHSSSDSLSGAPASPSAFLDPSEYLRIALGSCADDDAPEHPVWDALLTSDPDTLLLMGDNVYADTPEFKANPSVELMLAEYAKLSATPGFAELRATRPVLATWDDHDFGANDGGADFAFKTQAAQIFQDYWEYPADDPARSRPGIYTTRRINHKDIDVQVLLLDTRSFRAELQEAPRSLGCPIKNYEPNTTGSFLGAEQWLWLEQQLQEPADLRLLVSSQQVIPDQHCFEKWGNFPGERVRLFELLRESGVQNLLIVSGDRHLGEISLLPATAEAGAGFNLFEVTASPLSARSGFGWGETNDYRVSEDNLRESQFGVLDIARVEDAIRVAMQLRDDQGAVRFEVVTEFAASLSK